MYKVRKLVWYRYGPLRRTFPIRITKWTVYWDPGVGKGRSSWTILTQCDTWQDAMDYIQQIES